MSDVIPECYHCGLPVPPSTNYKFVIFDETRTLCCAGCEAVAQAIVDNGLGDYYRYRTELPKTAEALVPEALRQLDLYDLAEVQKSFVHEEADNLKQAALILEGITCAACIWLNERHLKQLPGVQAVSINYTTHRARISWNSDSIKLSSILAEIRKLGYQAHPFNVQQQEAIRQKRKKKDFRRIAIAALSAGQVMMLAVALYAGAAQGMELATNQLLRWFSLLLATPAVLYAAIPFYQSAWTVLKQFKVNMDVPITLGLVGGFLGSVWATIQGQGVVYYDTLTMLVFFLLTTRFLERNASERSVEAAENLLRLAPAMATRLRDGVAELVPVMDLSAGEWVLVKPGETLPADGIVTEGSSSVDESLLTGESRPLPKTRGDHVVAGSINYESPLQIEVTEVGENTVLAGIARLLDRAQSEKPRMAQWADTVAGWFTYVLLALVLFTGLLWYWLDSSRAFEIVLSVLVVSCPCALSLAAPAAFAAAGSHLIARGVLLTRGHALETLSRVTHFVFDKTGTLTLGRPTLLHTMTFSPMDAATCLHIAASLEQASEHPLAQCFLQAVEKSALIPLESAENRPGFGIAGTVQGENYTLGNSGLAAHIVLPELVLSHANQGATVVWLCNAHQALAAFLVGDVARPQAKELITSLQASGQQVSILSGDSENAVAHYAQSLGVKQWFAALSPEGKLDKLEALKREGAVVAMVGDGINDAPVLAGAPVSIAMGGGSQMARASGDIVLLSENLMEIAHAHEMSRFAMRVVRQNFLWALAYNLVALPFAMSGHLSPWLAAIGMSASSLVVVLNALRLR